MNKTTDDILKERRAQREARETVLRERRKDFAPAEHPAIPIYENAPCYDPAQMTELQHIGVRIMETEDRTERLELVRKYTELRDSIRMQIGRAHV